MRIRLAITVIFLFAGSAFAQDTFFGRHYAGRGDVEYLQLLDIARRQLEPDPEFQNLAMLYEPSWNGFYEGAPWDSWWIQNSYGPSYCAMPFLLEPYTTFLANSQAMWFAVQGDGKRADKNGYIAPDGCLVDAANPTAFYYRQGDGRHDIHDWFMEATAAGVVLQSELLLISRNQAEIERYIPRLERAVDFIEKRRDPKTGCYLAGPASNLLAPSYSGYKQPDGNYGKAILSGLQVTYIAALDRLIELEKFQSRADYGKLYSDRRDAAKKALQNFVTPEGYFVRSIDPDGTKHGLYGAPEHGYFESSVNHDAVAFRVASDDQSKMIYEKIKSIPQLRPHDVIIPNYPSYDDMYQSDGIFSYGTWINGGHWSTCEARAYLMYYRVGAFDDIRKSMFHMLDTFAKPWQMDNPLTDFGNAVWFKDRPVHLTYDALGPAAGMLRGLFEYLYKSDRLILIPHIPESIARLEQRDPVRFGNKRIFITTYGAGPITGAVINGEMHTDFTPTDVTLTFDKLPEVTNLLILLGDPSPQANDILPAVDERQGDFLDAVPELRDKSRRIAAFRDRLTLNDFAKTYEINHAGLALQTINALGERRRALRDSTLKPFPETAATAADKMYLEAATKLCDGLDAVMKRYETSQVERERKMSGLWNATGPKPNPQDVPVSGTP